jgi:hypothetical protein
MKKNLLVIVSAVLSFICLAGCQSQNPSSELPVTTTAESSADVSSSDSASSEIPQSFYEATLKNGNFEFYSIQYSSKVVKDSVTYKTASERKEVFISSNANQTSLEHVLGSYTVMGGYEDNDSTVSKTYETYRTPSATYNLQDDGKYSTTAETNTLSSYHLTYDFSKIKSYTLQRNKYDVNLTGTISQGDLSGFLGQDKLSDVTDFAFSFTLSKLEAYLQEFSFTYTQKGYSVKAGFVVSSAMSSLVLPTSISA